jgi:hypothetical protein
MIRNRIVWQFAIIQIIVWSQRGVRLILRAAWTGAAVFLLGWGVDSLWGILPDVRLWTIAGSVVGSISIIRVFLPWPRIARLAWSLDRRMGLKEQISAAWLVVVENSGGQIPELLVQDAANLLTQIRSRIALRGWSLAREFVSLVIVGVLLWLVFWGQATSSPIQLSIAQTQQLPQLGEDPTTEQIFPSGIPGLQAEAPRSPGDGQQSVENQGPGEADTQLARLNALKSALKNLGKRLSQQTVSYGTSQALQQGDLDRAADELEMLADKVPGLSEDAKDQLALSLKEASDEVKQNQQPAMQSQHALPGDLQAASKALEEGDDLTVKKSLDLVAEDFRSLSDQISRLVGLQDNENGDPMTDSENNLGGSGASSAGASRDSAEPLPISRLQGENDTLEIGEFGDQSGFLSPGKPTSPEGTSTFGGVYDSMSVGDQSVISSILSPYYYPWMWRDVVSTYFSPQ